MNLDQYTVIVRQVGLHYVALCLELNVASQGDSPTQVRQNIADAIREYLAYMEKIDATDEIQPVPFDLLREFLPVIMGKSELSAQYIRLILRQPGFTGAEIDKIFE